MSTDDPWCQCGYRRSLHGDSDRCPHQQSKTFTHSKTFNDEITSAEYKEWVEGNKKKLDKKGRGK